MKNNACRLSVIIISTLFVLCGSTLGSTLTSEALGLTPGSVEFTSGYEGAYQDSAAQMDLAAELGELTSPFCELTLPSHQGLAPRSEPYVSCKLGMAAGFKTKREQMDLTSEEATEATLLEKLGPFEVPESEQVKLAPEKAPDKPTGAEKLFSGEEMESGAFEPALAHGAEIYTPKQTPTSSVSHPVLKDHDPVLRHHLSDKNFLAPSLRPTLLLGSIFPHPTVIIP